MPLALQLLCLIIYGMTFPELLSHHFLKIQTVLFVCGTIIAIRVAQGKSSPSQFRSREADRNDLDNLMKPGPDLAKAKLARAKPQAAKVAPLALPGVRLSGEPHEILGLHEDASEADVQKAYKESIKRFHPDRIQGQAKEQILFYQEASAKLNQAKEDMIRSIRARK